MRRSAELRIHTPQRRDSEDLAGRNLVWDRPWAHKALTTKQTVAAIAAERSIRREGDYWTIVWGGLTLHFKDSKGFRCLARLLAEPHVEVHALELAGGELAGSATMLATSRATSLRYGDVGPIIDHRAKAEYRARLHELDEEIDEAKDRGDIGRAERAEEEKLALVRHLASALGLGGRDRKLPSPGERARVNVTRTIRAAIKNIERSHPALGGHLRASIRTGTFCSYRPDPGVPDRWRTG